MKPIPASGGAQAPPELVFDSALEVPEQDLLDRAEFAKSMARSILTLSADEPFTIGLHGPTGSGKSTVLHFLRHYLAHTVSLGAGGIAADPLAIVSFNPQLYPDPAQLPVQFYRQIQSAAARVKPLEAAAAAIDRFASGLAASQPANPYEFRREASALLRDQDARILVVVDDLDRLEPRALLSFFNLSTALALPRFIYLFAFDRDAARHSLEVAHVADAEAFLGKTIQLPYDVPEPDKLTLRQMLGAYVEDLFAGTPPELYSEGDWEQFFFHGLDPLLAGPREIKRFVNAMRSSYPAIEQEVNFVDFAAVQTLRVFAPGIYRFLIANKPMLTGAGSGVEVNEKQARLARIDAMSRALHAVPEPKRAPVDHILQYLFPEWETGLASQRRRADSRARLERRVSSPDVFDVYFNPSIPAGSLTRTEIRSILALAPHPADFSSRLLQLAAQEGRAGKSKIDAFLEHMQDYTREEIPVAHIPALLEAVFDSGDRFCSKLEREPIPARRNDYQLLFIVSQLLRRLADEAARADLLAQLLPNANSLYLAVRFALRIDPESSRDAAGWSSDTAKAVRATVLDRIRATATTGDLAAVPYLDTVFSVWENWAAADEPRDFAGEMAKTDEGIARLLVGALKPLAPGETRFHCNLDFLTQWTALDFTELAPRCRDWLRSKPDWMTEVQHVALDAFVSAIGSAATA
jgi:predicted KAP-like P-loop ATPase